MKTSTASMGQRYAKHQMQSGVRLYHQRHHHRAITKWRKALRRLASPEDRFVTLGYIAQAYCDSADYESMLHYSLQQMELANIRHDNYMKSEAFLNLSKAYERLADFSKAISYGKASLQHPSIDPRTPGYAYLESIFGLETFSTLKRKNYDKKLHSILTIKRQCQFLAIALAQMGFSQFQTSLEAFEKAMNVANETGDKLLELQICVGLGALFTLLRDLTKALIFLRNALTILQLITVDNVHAKYKSAILYHLSVVLRLKGALGDAREACEEALRLSQDSGSKAIYARCLCSLADIYREIGESEARETITKSWARYEQAFRIMREINDRMGEVIILGSMAKSASESRSHYTGQCECQAIQLNKKCLEISKLIGCKHAMMKCHQRLQELYVQLNDEDSEDVARKTAITLIQEMELFCNFCGQRYGLNDDSLQALRCSHIFHEKCLKHFLHERDSPTCPKCQCKAILMENVSMGTSSGSSNNENEPIQMPSSSKENKPLKEAPLGGIQTCFLQATTTISNHITPSISEDTSLSYPQTTFPPHEPLITIQTPKPVILVHSPSQETSDDASSTPGTSRPKIIPTGSATPVICRVNQPTDNSTVPSAVVTRQRSPLATIKKPKPPPPPRKPNCKSHGIPPLPPELLVGIGAAPIISDDSSSSPNDTIRYIGPGVTDV